MARIRDRSARPGSAFSPLTAAHWRPGEAAYSRKGLPASWLRADPRQNCPIGGPCLEGAADAEEVTHSSQVRWLRSIEPPIVLMLRLAGAPRPTRPLATLPSEAETTCTDENPELIDPKRVRASTRTDELLGKVTPIAPLVFLNTAGQPGSRLPWKLIVPLCACTSECPRRRVEIVVMVPLSVMALTWPLTWLVLMAPLAVCSATAPRTLAAEIDPLVSCSTKLPVRPVALSVPAATWTFALVSRGTATWKSTHVAVGRPLPIETVTVITSPCCR